MIPLFATGLLLSGALAAPHLVRLDEAPPVVAASIWFSALLLRAATTIASAAFFVAVVSTSGVYEAVSHWCWHAVLPLITAHLGLSGHSILDVAVLLPGAVLAFSALTAAVGLAKATRKVRSLLSAPGLGSGPDGSVIIRDRLIVVATAGLRRPRVVVSAGALARLNESELRASLEHERGHIDRRHRWILLMGELAHALGRFVPGSRMAFAELTFHLERDADRFALARDHQPRALASAICKAAESNPWTRSPAMGLGGSGVVRRVSQLVGEAPPSGPPRLSRALALLLAGLVLAVFAAIPAAAMAAIQDSAAVPTGIHCSH